MKLLVALAAVLLALAPVACGSGDGESSDEALEAKVEEYLTGPEIKVPPGPPPEKTVIKDLKVGSGQVAKQGDKVFIHYVGVAWVTREPFSRRWEPDPPARYWLGHGTYPEFEKAIEGMREGGRREFTVPNYRLPAIIYVVDLESVEPGGPASS